MFVAPNNVFFSILYFVKGMSCHLSEGRGLMEMGGGSLNLI